MQPLFETHISNHRDLTNSTPLDLLHSGSTKAEAASELEKFRSLQPILEKKVKQKSDLSTTCALAAGRPTLRRLAEENEVPQCPVNKYRICT
jgi:hypothetical protein